MGEGDKDDAGAGKKIGEGFGRPWGGFHGLFVEVCELLGCHGRILGGGSEGGAASAGRM